MHDERFPIERLAQQAREGDTRAMAELRQELERQLTHMVRQVLRTRKATSVLTRRILKDLEQCLDRTASTEAQERLVYEVAVRICDAVIDRLSPGVQVGKPLETVRA